MLALNKLILNKFVNVILNKKARKRKSNHLVYRAKRIKHHQI